MFDPAFIESCADRSLPIEIVERFIAEAGNENPLSISITSGNRVILPEPPKTPEEAARLAQRFVGAATLRAGVTNFPVGVGISDASEITADLFNACKNIAMGTALFGKVYRVVAHARGTENGVVLRAAFEAWRSGLFEQSYVFSLPDPGPLPIDSDSPEDAVLGTGATEVHVSPTTTTDAKNPNAAGMRINIPEDFMRKD